ncbi:MAG: hypothetical protein IT335_14375, partial [Thermomicrobiales bacterium]|nr:hypothetical protein [Thermomicrobiales bacterium]
LIVQNSSADLSADLQLEKVPDDKTFDDMKTVMEQADRSAPQPPDIYYQLVIAGGASAGPGGTGEAIIDLTAGDWILDLTASPANEDAAPAVLPTKLTVTGDMPELADPTADVTVDMQEMAFDMPDSIPAGDHIWQVNNKGSFLHFMAIQSYPEAVTADQVQATLDSMFGTDATPAASPNMLLDPSLFVEAGGAAVLSTGQTSWIELDLQPGQYIAFCFMSGPGSVPVHAAMGMFKVITVE